MTDQRVERDRDSSLTEAAIQLDRSSEQLRQEAAVFDRRLDQDKHWFRVRVGMAALAGAIIVGVFVAALIMVWSDSLPDTVRATAAAAMIADVVAVAATTWKVVLGDGSFTNISPVTQADAVAEGT